MIAFSNLEEFQRELERLRGAIEHEADNALGSMRDTVHQALMLLATHAADYPPPPPGSTYRRTRTLGRLWTQSQPQITVSGHILDARIENATPYGPYVQDPDKQAAVHRGRWQTTDEVTGEHVDEIAPLLASAGLEIVERIANAV